MDIKNIGIFLQNQRKNRGWTQSELAQILGVSHQAISRWEKGENLPEVIKLVELGDLYQLKVDQILNCDVNDFSLSENKRDFSRLSLYTTLNLFLAGLSIIVYFAMLFSTSHVWAALLVQYGMIISAQLIFVIPFSQKTPKILNDYRHLRLNTIGSLTAVFITLIPSFIGFSVSFEAIILAGVLLVPMIVIMFLLNKAMMYHELCLFNSLELPYHEYLIHSLKDNNLLFVILKNIFILGVFYLVVYSFTFISQIFNNDFDYYYIYVIVISITTTISILAVFKNYNLLNLFFAIEIFVLGLYLNFLIYAEGVLTQNQFDTYTIISDIFHNGLIIFVIGSVLMILGYIVFKKEIFIKNIKISLLLISLFIFEIMLQGITVYYSVNVYDNGVLGINEYGLDFEYNSFIFVLVIMLYICYKTITEIIDFNLIKRQNTEK